MALEHLLAALERDADAKAAALRAEARREAGRLAATARERIEERRAAFAAQTEAGIRAASRAAVAEAAREARRLKLEARQRLLDRVFEAARERLPAAVRSPASARSLPGEIAEALSYLEDGAAVLRCTPGLEAEVRRAIPHTAVRVIADPTVGSGVRIAAADGSLRVDATLDGRLARLRPELSLDVLRQVQEEVPACAGTI